MILANQMAAYLVGSNDQQLNYLAGQTAVVRLDAAAQPPQLHAICAGQAGVPCPADLNRRDLTITDDRAVGNYRLQAGGSRRSGSRFQRQLCPGPDAARPACATQELSGVFGR